MSWPRWVQGRQGGSSYQKMLLLASDTLAIDCYLIRLQKGDDVRIHRDPVSSGFEHHRLNIILRFADGGGETWVQDQDLDPKTFRLEHRRWYHFRPDKLKHVVTNVTEGSMLILSIGWLCRGDL